MLSSLNIHCFGCHCKATAAAERLSTEQCCKALQDKRSKQTRDLPEKQAMQVEHKQRLLGRGNKK